jgi:hypothetical protein
MDSRTQDPTAPGTSPADERIGGEPATDDQSPAHAFADAKERLAEVAEHISYLLAAKVDGAKASLRNIVVMAAIGVIGLIALCALVTSAVVLVCAGLAGGLSALFGERLWQGMLVAGLAILTLLGIGVWLGVSRVNRGARQRTVQKYAARQQQQRARFGKDVHERAGHPGK